MQANSNAIPGFETLTKQQLFDISSAHILKTRERSAIGHACTYAGVGCGAAPFLTQQASDRLIGSWGWLVQSGEVSAHEAYFISDLQRCHDGASTDEDCFMREWKTYMREVAKTHGLSTHLIDADKGEV